MDVTQMDYRNWILENSLINQKDIGINSNRNFSSKVFYLVGIIDIVNFYL